MKTIEEKAKAYDEAIQRMKGYVIDEFGCTRLKPSDIFPELAESEGEKTKRLLHTIANKMGQHLRDIFTEEEFQCFDAWSNAWLEKQGEHKKFRDSIQVGDKVTRNEDGVLVNLSQLNRVTKKDEKQGKQKPADKVEQNFRKGDWVVYCNDDVDLITGIEENGYTINEGGYIPFVCASDIRLWTIQDAKDGDVLFTSSTASHETFIFKNIDEKGNAKCYFAYDSEDGFREGKYHFIGRATDCKPATKEQRDLLFQKMKEAGYEWDADKKELRKIEQKPAWSEEDEENRKNILYILNQLKGTAIYKEDKTAENCIDWLKSLRLQKLSNVERNGKNWKPSEEQMETLEYYMHTLVCNKHKEILFGLYADLKKLTE